MRRTPAANKIILSVLAIAGIAGALIYPHSAAAIGLHEDPVIEGPVIRLGDVFTGLTRDADKALGAAPLPGKQMVLDSRTLLRIAVALDLPWRPETSADYVVLKRAATVVDGDMIREVLKTSLAENGVNGDFRLVLDEEPGPMVLPQKAGKSVEVLSINVRPEKNWFEADLAAPSKDKPLATARVSGRIERMTKIPALRETLRNGTIIGERDIDFISVPARTLKSNAVLRADDLMGMTPRNVTLAGQPITANEIEAPRIVQRGEVVTMVFNGGGLQLTAQGKALEHGSKGDRIRVMNTSSQKTITAEVTNVKEVTLIE